MKKCKKIILAPKILMITATFVFSACFAGNAIAKTWGPPEVVDDSSMGDGIGPISASWDAYGNIHVAWESWVTLWSNINYKRWNYSTGLWEATRFWGGFLPHLDSDRGVSGVSHTFLTYESGEGVVVKRDGVKQILDADAVVHLGSGAQIAVEEQTGIAHIVYKKQPAYGLPLQLYYSKYSGTSWSTSTAITSSSNIMDYDVAVDRFGHVHVVWAEIVSFTPSTMTLYYLKNTLGSGWGTPYPLSTSSNIDHVNIKTDRHDPPYVHVVWQRRPGPPYGPLDIYYKSWRKIYKSWRWSSEENLSNDSYESSSPGLTTDPSGGVHVVWLKDAGREGIIRYRKWVGSWQPVEELTSSPHGGWSPFIISDWFDNLYLFYANDNSERLMLRRFADFGANTPVGSDVEVTIDGHTVTFTTVSAEGETTISAGSTGPSLPSNFQQSCTPPIYYDITTTATYSGDIEVCLSYDDTVCDETDLHLYHREGSTWVDCTTSVDTANDIICGTVSSLSLFVLAVPACPGDFDDDGDVDGSDLAVFAADFGRTDCGSEPPCGGDFDDDGDVDGSDLAVFAADFGRTNCPR